MADKMPMGIGALGAPNIIIKRKFRWTLDISTPCGSIPASYCKIAARPHLEVEETELNFLNASTWMPGKGKWQPLNVTYIDVAGKDMQGLYDWMATIYDFTDPINLTQGEKGDWAGAANLKLYDGCGQVIETWLLEDVFPTSIDFGDLDYSSGELANIQMTLRYSKVQFYGGCGLKTPKACCKGCTGGGDDDQPSIGVTPGIQSVRPTFLDGGQRSQTPTFLDRQ